MNSNLIYRASFYIMLTVATMILCGEVTDTRLNWLLPMTTAAAGFAAFLTVDQNRRWGLPRDLANFLALGTLGVLYLEYRADPNQLITCLGHWLIYLQLIKYFLPKTEQDDWFLFLLGLTEVLIGSVTNQGDMVGAWLLFWATLAVWVLGLFFLQREARRFQNGAAAVSLSVRTAQKDDPYHGLFDMPYLAASLRVLSLTMLLGGLFFLLLPRQAGATRARSSNVMSRHLTGFDEEVTLGQLGEILENDSVVMSVEFADEDHKATRPIGEPLWRGVTLIHYEKGRWRRMQHLSPQTIVSLPLYSTSGPSRRQVIRQLIKLEPNDSASLFGLRPMLELSATTRLPPLLNPVDGTIFRPESRGGYEYEVLSDVNSDAPQEGEMEPSDQALRSLRDMPAELQTRFREIALRVVKNMPEKGIAAIKDRARELEGYLRDSREFSYTLEMSVAEGMKLVISGGTVVPPYPADGN